MFFNIDDFQEVRNTVFIIVWNTVLCIYVCYTLYCIIFYTSDPCGVSGQQA